MTIEALKIHKPIRKTSNKDVRTREYLTDSEVDTLVKITEALDYDLVGSVAKKG